MNTIPDADKSPDSGNRLRRRRHCKLLLSVAALVTILLLLIETVSAAQLPGQPKRVLPSSTVSTFAGSFGVTHVQTSTVASPTAVAVPTVTANPIVATSSSTQPIFGVMVDSQSPSFAIIVEAISVLLFGGVLALILEWQRRRYQRSQEHTTSNEAKYRYLLGIKREIESILNPFEDWIMVIGNSERFREMQDRGEDFSDTSSTFLSILNWGRNTYWDALVPSGLLPSLASPDLLARIADFYQQLHILFRQINDIVRAAEQRALRIASRDSKYAAFAEAVFGAPHQAEEAKQIGKNFEQFLLLGKNALDKLEEELRELSNHLGVPGEPTSLSSHESVSEPKQDKGFEDITLLSLNEHLTKLASEFRRSNGSYYPPEENPELFTFVLRLSDKPPLEWGEKVHFGPLEKKTDMWGDSCSDRPYTATVNGRYLLVESRKDELIENILYLRLAIAQQNEAYRERLVNEAAAREREVQQAAILKQEIIDFKEQLDSEIAKDIDLESILSQPEDTQGTNEDHDEGD